MPQNEKFNLYDSIAEDYTNKRKKPWKYFIDFFEEIRRNYLLNMDEQGKICCDLGCGSGRHLKYLADRSSVYIGTDLSFSMLKIALNQQSLNNNVQLIMCDAEKLPFRGKKISLIVSIALIHHILSKNRRKRTIENISSILVKDGLLLLSVWSATKGKNAYAVKKGNYTMRMRKKSYRYAYRNSSRYKLLKNDLYIPWKIIDETKRKTEIARIYHFFSFNEVQSLSIASLGLVHEKILGNIRSGFNYFLLLKKNLSRII